tara:strand:- start:8945 stop:9085 length:141 start_codon:yes stop_codon:yes gene_type:complete
MAVRPIYSVSLPPEPPGDVASPRTLVAFAIVHFFREVFPDSQEVGA